MQPIATIVVDLHLEEVMTYTLQIMPVPITTIIADVTLTEAVTVTTTSLQEAAVSVPVMQRCIMKPFRHKKGIVRWVSWWVGRLFYVV